MKPSVFPPLISGLRTPPLLPYSISKIVIGTKVVFKITPATEEKKSKQGF